MQTKSEPPDKSPTAAIRNVQFSVSKGAARKPDAAPRIPRREVNLFFERDGLLGGDGGWLFAEELSKQTDYRFYQLNNQFERCGQNIGKKIYNAMEKGCKLSEE